MNHKVLNSYLSEYYPRLLNFSRARVRAANIRDSAEDILQDAMLSLCLMPIEYIEKLLMDEQKGTHHLLNYLRMVIMRRIKDAIRSARACSELNDNDYYHYNSTLWLELDDEKYMKLREVSCNLRPDDFTNPLESVVYVPHPQGWVSGWIHADIKKNGARYVYWYYSAFVGSRAKGDIPKRLKTSISRHEAYVSLMQYNNRLRA